MVYFIDANHFLGSIEALRYGNHKIEINVAHTEGLPCIYVDGKKSASNSSWEVNDFSFDWLPAGCNNLYLKREDNPNTFAFTYECINPCRIDQRPDGILYDYGKETFASLEFKDVHAPGDLHLYYGESSEEALDVKHSILIDRVPAHISEYRCPPRAFRYLFIQGAEPKQFSLTAWYEYLPLDKKGAFTSSNDMINQIWATAEYTFHLNSREFFLDGIKRDRWVWSGDAYQSYFINNYLFF